MMQSEQEEQRNLQQSRSARTAEYTTCNEHKKAGACAGKKQEECEESKEYLWQQ